MSRVPCFLFLAAALFWGWRTGYWLVGVVLGIILEGCSHLKIRWVITENSYCRIWDLCCLMLIAGLLVFGISGSRSEVERSFLLVQWLPLFFLPIILAQLLGDREKISYRVFSWLMRHRTMPERQGGLNIEYLYLLLILCAAAATNRRDAWFYPALVMMGAWIFWRARSRRFGRPIWVMIIMITGLMGYGTHLGLNRLQNYLESRIGSWFGHLLQSSFDPMESRTSMGQIGKLKLSGRIMYRLQPDHGEIPVLVRQACYNQFAGTTWSVRNREFVPIASSTNDTWELKPDSQADSAFHITGYARRGRAVLPISVGTIQIDHLPALTLETNYLGVVRASDVPGLFNYRVAVEPGSGIDGPITVADLEVPIGEEAVLDRILKEVEIKGSSAEDICGAIAKFFEHHFRYSIYLERTTFATESATGVIPEFLLKTRSGHCEYFATATVLLLRRANVPARYAVGYAVEESNGPKEFLLRERHAHAWALVHYNGAWHDLDTTPSSWREFEAQQASFFQPLFDLWDGMKLEFMKWRWGKSNYHRYLIWPILLLAAGLIYRILSNLTRSQGKKQNPKNSRNTVPTLLKSSEFYLVEKVLSEQGWPRFCHLPFRPWLDQIELLDREERAQLDEILNLHYRLRFDPHGLTLHQRNTLRLRCEKCLIWLRLKKTVVYKT